MEWEIAIDSSGRLVIPKDVRTRHHLNGGARLVLRDDGTRLVLIPWSAKATMVEEHGLLVFQGRLRGDDVDHRTVRDARLAALAGL